MLFRSFNKAFKRIKGVDRATRSLARKEIKTEEVQIDELSKGTLASYAKKAADDTALRARYDNRDQPSPTKKTIKRLLGTKKAIDKLAKEEVDLDEAVKLKSKVTIHAPGQSYHGKTGHIGEIRHGLAKSSPKTYTVDYDERSEEHTSELQSH